jgi:hypothetical protein
MENMMVNRDGSCRIRPGLRYFNYDEQPLTEGSVGVAAIDNQQLVGTHETFYTEYGKAYLYAVLENDGTVGFRVFADDGTGVFYIQSLAEALFDVPQGEVTLNFTGDTTYVKYLQIDNKIFALSNAGESMRMFSVGTLKKAQVLYSIDRPAWDLDDKLTVVHPPESWVNGGTPIATRINKILNPTFELSLDEWETRDVNTNLARSATFGHSGTYSMRLSSLPIRKNLCKHPLHNTAGGPGTAGWSNGTGLDSNVNNSGYMRSTLIAGESFGQVVSDQYDVEGDTRYVVGLTMGPNNRITKCQMRIFYYNSSGDAISNALEDTFIGISAGRKETETFVTPGGARSIKIAIRGDRDSGGTAYFDIKDVYLGLNSEGDSTALDGDDGADFYWAEGAGAPDVSVEHPAQDLGVTTLSVSASEGDYYASIYARSSATPRTAYIHLKPESSTGSVLSVAQGADTPTGNGAWDRIEDGATVPAATATIRVTIVVEAVPRGEYHYFDSALLERDNVLGDYFSGATDDDVGFNREWEGDRHDSRSFEHEYAAPLAHPGSATKTANTLISSTSSDNDISFGFFYTFSNDIGESAASQATIVRVQRPWSSWMWESMNASAEPSGTPEDDPELCADQLVAYMPGDVFTEAIAQGAISWSLYMFTWSDQEPFPVSAVLVENKTLDADSVYPGTQTWIRLTPSQAEISTNVAPIPTKHTRYNSSDPSTGGQGIVAADRMVLVFDPMDAAVIRWSSNQQGSYYDFSIAKGGGYKTLTSGNLYVPACVKLWQNPQSADTLTILMLGTDGHSTGYYMQPAQVASQSEAVNIMGFEETTATPGTVSPFGCEVLNNALYHPVEDQLMKSVASNYNINHTSMTDKIANMWRKLDLKEHIVSSQFDNRLYFLVNNPNGATLDAGCWGNEVWVFDAAAKAGSWSRWLVQGHSLRKIEFAGEVVMSLVHPTGIFYFDQDASTDDYVDTATGDVLVRNIPWLMETNTQGANRAHDAWANLQQANLVLGNFQGKLRYGVRGYDLNGKVQDISKLVLDNAAVDEETWDLEDFLLIRRIMKEWYFYAESVTENDVVQPSAGQISLVQYRYTPSTVNTGYEFGSVETFEYGRAIAEAADRTTDSGTPTSYIDTGRP